MQVLVEYNLLDEYQEKIHERIKRALADGAAMVQGDAMGYAPVDTGRLRASIAQREISPLSHEVYTNVSYSIHQEFGTRYQPGQAFMRPSYEKNRPRIIEMLNRELQTL